MKAKFVINSYQEYLLFLYIYLANSDYNIQFAEVNTILSKMEDLFPGGMDLEGMFLEVKDKFDKLDNDEVESMIRENYLNFRTKLPNPERFFNDLFDIIVSDGIIQDYEMEAFDKIKRIVQS